MFLGALPQTHAGAPPQNPLGLRPNPRSRGGLGRSPQDHCKLSCFGIGGQNTENHVHLMKSADLCNYHPSLSLLDCVWVDLTTSVTISPNFSGRDTGWLKAPSPSRIDITTLEAVPPLPVRVTKIRVGSRVLSIGIQRPDIT